MDKSNVAIFRSSQYLNSQVRRIQPMIYKKCPEYLSSSSTHNPLNNVKDVHPVGENLRCLTRNLLSDDCMSLGAEDALGVW